MRPHDSMKKRKDLLSEHSDLFKEVEEEIENDPSKHDLKNDPRARHEYEEFLREEFEDPEHSDVLIEKQSKPDERDNKRPKI